MAFTKEQQTRRKAPAPPRHGSLRQRSEKLAETMQDEYLPAKRIFIARHRECAVNVRGVCHRWTRDVHHKGGRTGAALMDQSLWVPACRQCHDYLETHRAWAKEHGFLVARTVRRQEG